MLPWRSPSKLKCFQASQLVTATRNVGVRLLSFQLLIFPTATPDLQPTAASPSPLGPERGSSINMSTDVEGGSSHHTKQLRGLGVKHESHGVYEAIRRFIFNEKIQREPRNRIKLEILIQLPPSNPWCLSSLFFSGRLLS